MKKSKLAMFMVLFIVFFYMPANQVKAANQSIIYGNWETCTISSYGETKKYDLTVTEDAEILFTLKRLDSVGIYYIITDSNGTEVYNHSDYASREDFEGYIYLNAGIYTITFGKTFGNGDSAANFNFKFNYESINSNYGYRNYTLVAAKDSPAIPVNTQINAMFDELEGKIKYTEYYKINIPCKGEMSFSITDAKRNGNSIEIQVLDSNGNAYEIKSGYPTTNRWVNKSSDAFTMKFSKKQTIYIAFAAGTGNIYGKYFFTANFKPKTPKVKCTASKNSVKLTSSKTGTITGYTIKYKKQSAKKWKEIKVKGNKHLNKKIKKLKSNTTYVYKVKLDTKSGGIDCSSAWTKTKKIITK